MNERPESQKPEAGGDEPVRPIPPRYGWLKRIALGCVFLLLVLLALRLWWGHVAHSRLQAEIDRIRAAGEPIFPEDFDSPPVPADQNAALLYQQAANSFTVPPAATRRLDELSQPWPLSPEDLAEARLYIEANTNALALLRRARDAPQLDWGLAVRSPVFNVVLPALGGYRELARLLAVSTRYHLQMGSEAEAVGAIRDMLALAAAVEHGPFLISNLVAVSIYPLATKAVEVLTPGLNAGSRDDRTLAFDPWAGRSDTIDLIGDLLDERAYHHSFVRCLQGERGFVVDVLRSCAEGKMSLASLFTVGPPATPSLSERMGIWLSRPLIELDGLEVMRYQTAWIEASKEPTWPAVAAKRPHKPAANGTLRDLLMRPVSTSLRSSFDGAARRHFHSLADRRMAAAALAIRLYEIDHGRRPEQLMDLVPDYVPELPIDPYSADARAIGYRPDAIPPVLYSVGADGIDDNGAFSFSFLSQRSRSGINEYRLDQPFFLNGTRPRSPDDLPSTQPGSAQGSGQDVQEQRDEAEPEEDETPEDQPEER